ncbi:MAG: hypothetical protein ACTSXZ_11695 [Alphaproteobacteria bacterium]
MDDDDDDACPPVDCASCGDRVVWFTSPEEGATAMIGDIIEVTVQARSPDGVNTLGFVALGELAGIPLQLAHETAGGSQQTEATATFELAVPFNANIEHIVLVALAEDAAGHLRAEAKAFTVLPYQ